jgi:hypothetical protein
LVRVLDRREGERDLQVFQGQIERVVDALRAATARLPGSGSAAPEAPSRPSLHASLTASRISRLARELSLDEDDLGLLWVGIALACDPRALPLAQLLVGADAQAGISVGLYAAAASLAPERAQRLALRLAADHPLLDHGLLVGSAGEDDVFAPRQVATRLLRHLAGDDRIDPALLRVGGAVLPPADPVLDGAATELVSAIDEAVERREVVLLEGAAGSGRRALAALAGQRRLRQVVELDLSRVPAEAPATTSALAALSREQVLTGAVALVSHLPSRSSPQLAVLARFLDRGAPAIVVGEPGCDLPIERHVVRLRVEPPSPAQRRALWRSALGDEGLSAELGVRFKVNPGTIVEVARSFGRRAATGPDEVAAAIRRRMADRLAGLANRIEVRETWDDIVLPPDTQDQVRALLARCQNQHRVLEGWGFGRKVARGQGVAALFSGAPGTGKTMVAGLIARELGLDLYMVDLSRIVSKWVGETEKQLGRVFDAAEAGHVILLFDEADALFGKRGEAQGAQDRWANLEVNYLLSRIESFGGISLLTTNLDGGLDPAFRRRLAAHIHFWPPGPEERAELWRRMIPAEAPVADDIDLEHLALAFPELSGAHIRNAVVAAAFLASSDGPEARITSDHLERAARAEYRSMGRLLG